MAEKKSAQTDRHYENNGHLAVNQQALADDKKHTLICIMEKLLAFSSMVLPTPSPHSILMEQKF